MSICGGFTFFGSSAMAFEPGGDGSNANASLIPLGAIICENDGKSGGIWDLPCKGRSDRQITRRSGKLAIKFVVAERRWKVKVNYVLMWRRSIQVG